MKEFIEELEHNQEINKKQNLENRIDIDYVIERLKDIDGELRNYLNDRYNFLDSLLNYACNDNKDGQIYEYSMRKFEIENVINFIEGEQNEENN